MAKTSFLYFYSMEIKVIAYILFGLAYWYLKYRKEKSADVPATLPPPSQNKSNTPRGKSIEEILREIEQASRKSVSETRTASPNSLPSNTPAPKPVKTRENSLRPEQEGSVAYVPSILQTATSEGVSSLPEGISSISEIMKQEDEGREPMQIDLRQAFIHQLILERKTY